MSSDLIEFRRGVISPVECIKEAWSLIKDQYWLFLGICAAGMLIGSAFAIVLMGPMMCGIYLCLFQRMRNEPVSFDRLFKGFDFFAQSVIATLIQAIPGFVIGLPLSMIMMFAVFALSIPGGRGSAGKEASLIGFVIGMGVFVVVFAVLIILVGIFFMFTYPLIVDRKLSGVEAVKTSVKAALANLRGAAGFVILCALLGVAGVMFCYVGAFLVMPVTMAAQAVAYRRVFPEETQDPAAPAPATDHLTA